ncbi:type II toxin-antitoxin system RelE/ParE family toxin [Desulfomicrobium apsheronum]|uniref:type II toxin-antitoxin system RelE/ParE family toxin n=1 Tax=Desulfomicrobium apsheronum TaxID=52560 RepID=UPI001FE18B38|nr:type II toxin-antitoxin system RelE/ParE family toxin [Desulfomicrobium apsheronum]
MFLRSQALQGKGGVRKVRFAGEGRGKSGAYWVVYYYHSEDIPLFVLALFAKNEKANLTKAERNELKALMPQIVEAYIARKK